MPEAQPDRPRTQADFRVWHERQPEVWEFIDGVPKMLAPGSKAHTLIRNSAARLLRNVLDQTGRHTPADGAIVEGHGSSPIPDIVVTRAPPEFTAQSVDEPLIVEILSPSHQDRRQVVHHQRRDDLAVFLTSIAPADPSRLEPPGIELPLAAICAGLRLE